MNKFYTLIAQAKKADDEMIEDVDAYYDSVLNYILSHSGQRDEFAKAIIEMMKDPNQMPYTLVQFCMYELRWNEVKQAIVDWSKTEKSECVNLIIKKLLSSFEDDWYEANDYLRYNPHAND